MRYLRLCRRGAPHFRWKKALEGMTLGSLVGLGASQVERVGETIFSRRVGWCKVSEAESMGLLLELHVVEYSHSGETHGKCVKQDGEDAKINLHRASCTMLRILHSLHSEPLELFVSLFKLSYH